MIAKATEVNEGLKKLRDARLLQAADHSSRTQRSPIEYLCVSQDRTPLEARTGKWLRCRTRAVGGWLPGWPRQIADKDLQPLLSLLRRTT